MIEPCARRRRDHRFRAIGDAQPRLTDHRQIIGAVADRHRRGQGYAQRFGFGQQRCVFGCGIDDRFANRTSQTRLLDRQRVGNHPVEPDACAHGFGKARESARDEHAARTARAHGSNERPRANTVAHALGQAAIDRRFLEPFQQRHPRVERGREIEFAAHRRFGDFGDLVLDPGIIGEFVDALDGDHCRIHIGDDQFLFAALCGLDDHIDPFQRTLQRAARCHHVTVEAQVRCFILVNPCPFADVQSRRR